MRHLWSFLAGLVVAPVTWVLVTLGQDGSSRTVDRWVEIGTYNTANLIEPAVYLGVAGILLGLLGTLRISPLGPLVAGLLLITPYVGMFIAPFTVRDRIPDGWKVLGDPLPLRQPVENGTLFLIGLLLLMADVQRAALAALAATGDRGRSRPRPTRPTADAPATPRPTGRRPTPTERGHRPAHPRLPRPDTHRTAAPPDRRRVAVVGAAARRAAGRKGHRPRPVTRRAAGSRLSAAGPTTGPPAVRSALAAAGGP